MTIEAKAFARAGLMGNPSDGYYGKTIGVIIRNFAATVRLTESKDLAIRPSFQDRSEYGSIGELVADVETHGYYGGQRLLKATVRKFAGYCHDHDIALHARNFSLEGASTIPRRVGLAGSSALITAGLRCLMKFYEVRIPKPIQPGLILSVENEELGIAAGLQDRVMQVYEGCVFMDFDKDYLEKNGHGLYEELDPSLLPNLFVAYRTELAEDSEVFHNTIRERWLAGDSDVAGAMKDFASYAQEARDLIASGRGKEIGPLADANFDRRASIFRLSPENHEMVNRARSVGAHAKFAGSGGSIIGLYGTESDYGKLEEVYAGTGTALLKPQVLPGVDE